VRLVLYTGKGGVGKTTTAAATAVCAAERGRRTLLISADAAHSLGDVVACPLGPRPREIAPRLDAVEIDPRAETARRWGRISEFLVEVLQHQGVEAVVAEELALLPGAEEVTTLLAVEEFARSGAYDLLVVDCAPTDATLRLVTLPDVAHRALRVLLPLARAVSGVTVPLARALVSIPLPGSEIFRDAERLLNVELRSLQRRIRAAETSARIVVTPERMVIEESRRAYTELSLFEVPCDAVVINRLLPEVAEEEAFFRDWLRLQEERRREVEETFAPLPALAAPLQDDEVTGISRLSDHGRRIFQTMEPDALLSQAQRVRFERSGEDYQAIVPLPRAERGRLDVVKIHDDLTITTGLRRRSLKLPRRMAPLSVAGAKLEGAFLVVRFARDTAASGARSEVGPQGRRPRSEPEASEVGPQDRGAAAQ
jgi:arsenite-transporting ATPase